MDVRSKIESSIVRFLKLATTVFSVLVVLELTVIRHFDFIDDYMEGGQEIVSTFGQDNFMLFVGFSREVSNSNEHFSLTYVLIPKSAHLPSVLYIIRSENGDAEYENGSSLLAAICISLLLFGFYSMASYVKVAFFEKRKLKGSEFKESKPK